ncbi:Rne/Rng family ribonuclease [Telmatobacter bradus]|uniref:Rne/Rng family ribonuclease n=1 Tax=Telmatobacter bradus TaxID=474953 RepID=UPI003B437C06
MAKEICISSTPHETRLAILEDDQLSEIYYERENEYTLAGSIYNGRVTRVLPGMQSAFVDIGLERDAFLYVTDFMDIEETEDTDELEKAAVSGANTPPREVRHKEERPKQEERPSRREERREGREERRRERQAQPQPQLEEPAEVEEFIEPAALVVEQVAVEPSEEQGEGAVGGGRRWRGRRRRGRGRGQAGEEQTVEATEPATEQVEEIEAEPEIEHRHSIRAAAHEVEPEVEFEEESVAEATYVPAAEPVLEPVAAPVAAPARKPRQARVAEPAAFVLPGEQLTKYGGTPAEEAPKAVSAAPVRPQPSFKPATLIETPIEWNGVGLFPGESLARHRGNEPEAVVEDSASLKAARPQIEIEAVADEEMFEEVQDASATHHVDPSAPSGFRLFGFGKKKDDEHEEKPAEAAKSKAAGFQEELSEGEEFEEHSLPAHMRTGDLGEMLQEAHLDHRIGLDLDEHADEDGEEEEGEATPQQAGQQRRERGGRGRRGRGDQPQKPGSNRRGPSRRSMQTTDLPVITDLLKPGQEILVQIAKEPIAKKGARITSHIALPGRFLVFMPTVSHVGVSRKIASDEERHRLKKILVHERGEASGGFIVRTAAEGASEEELRADLRFLLNLWAEIKQRSDTSKSPALIYHDLSLIERILRDQVSSNFSNIWVDSEADYERIVRFLNRFSPNLVRRVKLYTKETPLFEHFGIQDEISKALRSKVWLKSGGSIVINQTEALVAIDINTGKYVGKSARLEDTIVKTNLDAVPEIVRQIRLRDLGGIIVIDFIDMDERKNRFKVLAALEEALKSDRAPTKVLQFNDFGLVAITRKRVKQSLERTLSVPCPTCQATGMVKSPATVCNEIWVELRKMKKHFESADVLLRVHPETVKVLKQNSSSWINDFEELIGRNILVKSDATLHPEQFDIQG